MKKILTSTVAIILFKVACADFYYQPYPISAQIVGNHIECTVYDTILGSYQNFTGPGGSVPMVLLANNQGMVGYYGDDGSFVSRGAVTYDMILHQFVIAIADQPICPCVTCNPPLYSADIANGIFHLRSRVCQTFYPVFNESHLYYDLMNHAWKGSSYQEIDCESTFSPYGIASYRAFDANNNSEYQFRTYYQNPRLHEFTLMAIGGEPINVSTPADVLFDDKVFVIHVEFHVAPYGKQVQFCYVSPDFIAPNNKRIIELDNAGQSYGLIYALTNSDTTIVGCFDIQNLTFEGDTLAGFDYSTISAGRFMYSILDTSHTIVKYGVYSFPQHAWITNSDTIPGGVLSSVITNETVTITPVTGAGYIKGYNDSIGWGSFITPPQPFFFLGNYSSSTEGNLIYVKDYSIGDTAIAFNFGDGFVSAKLAEFHLYKINGLYEGTPAANFTVCMSTAAGLNTCSTVFFPSYVGVIEQTNSNYLFIKNTSVNGLYEIVNQKNHTVTVNVYNAIGQKIMQTSNRNQSIFINIESQENGVYILNASDNESREVISKKVVWVK